MCVPVVHIVLFSNCIVSGFLEDDDMGEFVEPSLVALPENSTDAEPKEENETPKQQVFSPLVLFPHNEMHMPI
jgi:hypothetical protein